MSNPELRRNRWLELTPQRLIIMPLVLAGIFVLTHLLNRPGSADEIASTALFIAGVLLLFWGASQASESLLAEIREHTWDGQRMSAIGPWSLAWGKLLGGTLFSWYGGMIALAIFLFASDLELTARLRMAFIFIGGGIFCQALALLASLHSVRKNRKIVRSQSTALALLGLMFAWPLISTAFEHQGSAEWYGLTFPAPDFALTTLVFFAFWFVVGVYRQMRAELQEANGILVWLAFLLMVMAYVAGFVGNKGYLVHELIDGRLLMAYTIATGLLYAMALTEPKDPVTVSRLRRLFKARAWTRIGETLPCWAVTLPVVVILCLLLIVTGSGKVYTGEIVNISLFIASATLLVIRDIAFILYLNFAKNRKRADLSAVFYLALAYTLLPGLFKALGFTAATMLFWPQWNDHAGFGVVAVFLEAAAMVWLATRQWRNNYGQIQS